jgi:hypothetical protein
MNCFSVGYVRHRYVGPFAAGFKQDSSFISSVRPIVKESSPIGLEFVRKRRICILVVDLGKKNYIRSQWSKIIYNNLR